MPPQRIAGRYTVQRAVGHGGMGTVWLCHDEVLGRDVAVKQVGTLPGESTTDVDRALREARTSAALNHRNVVSIYDAVVDEEHNWLVMEYVPSRTLAEIIAAEGRLTPERVAGMGAQAADGLVAAHRRGTVHRDVKPSNILVTDDDHVKINDFGIARTSGDAMITRTGLVIGTPSYLSPELARGEEPDLPADVWALGATLFYAVEGRPLYAERPNAISLIAAIASEPAPPPEHAGFLTEPLLRMLDRDPHTRWSMEDVAASLARLHRQHPVSAPPVSTRTITPVEGVPIVAAAAVPEPAPAPEAEPVAAGPTPTRERPRPAPPPPPPDDRRRRGWLLPVAALLVLTLVGVGGYLLATRERDTPSAGASPSAGPETTPPPDASPSGSPTTPAEPSVPDDASPSSSPSASTSTSPVTDAAPTQFVQEYYSLLPGDPGAAYERLSPSYRSRMGLGSYEGFWSTIDGVRVDDVVAAGTDTVDVDLTYTRPDGRTESETRRIYLEPAGDGYVIASDEAI